MGTNHRAEITITVTAYVDEEEAQKLGDAICLLVANTFPDKRVGTVEVSDLIVESEEED